MVILEPLDRRHEYAKLAVARLDRQGGANRNAGGRECWRCGRLGLRHRAIRRERGRGLSISRKRTVGRHRGRGGQWLARRERIGGHRVRIVDRRHMGQRAQRQAQPDG